MTRTRLKKMVFQLNLENQQKAYSDQLGSQVRKPFHQKRTLLSVEEPFHQKRTLLSVEEPFHQKRTLLSVPSQNLPLTPVIHGAYRHTEKSVRKPYNTPLAQNEFGQPQLAGQVGFFLGETLVKVSANLNQNPPGEP